MQRPCELAKGLVRYENVVGVVAPPAAGVKELARYSLAKMTHVRLQKAPKSDIDLPLKRQILLVLSMKIADLPIAVRLGGAFAIVLAVLCAVVFVAWSQMAGLSGQLSSLTTVQLVQLRAANVLKDDANLAARAVRNALLLDEPKAIAAETQRVSDMLRSNEAGIDRLISRAGSDTSLRLALRVNGETKWYHELLRKASQLAAENQDQAGRDVVLGPLRQAQAIYFSALDELVAHLAQAATLAGEEAELAATRAQHVLLALSAFAIALSTALAWQIGQSVSKPLAIAMAACSRIERGDLSQPVEAAPQDEVGHLMRSLGHMQQQLSQLVQSVRNSAAGVATASVQIGEGSQVLSQRASEQASALEETAASLEELSTGVQSNAENAQHAALRSAEVKGLAEDTGQTITSLNERVADIALRSSALSEITDLIASLAFQTNILALNAAVEAARAGEHGLGFKVVADEVRLLANRSAAASIEIGTVIQAIDSQVRAASEQASEVDQTMKSVLRSVVEVSEQLASISTASTEQALSLRQMNTAVSQLDQVTQSNAAVSEENAAAAESLKSEASRLVATMALFKLLSSEPCDVPRSA